MKGNITTRDSHIQLYWFNIVEDVLVVRKMSTAVKKKHSLFLSNHVLFYVFQLSRIPLIKLQSATLQFSFQQVARKQHITYQFLSFRSAGFSFNQGRHWVSLFFQFLMILLRWVNLQNCTWQDWQVMTCNLSKTLVCGSPWPSQSQGPFQ